jgi:hypothetical protein
MSAAWSPRARCRRDQGGCPARAAGGCCYGWRPPSLEGRESYAGRQSLPGARHAPGGQVALLGVVGALHGRQRRVRGRRRRRLPGPSRARDWGGRWIARVRGRHLGPPRGGRHGLRGQRARVWKACAVCGGSMAHALGRRGRNGVQTGAVGRGAQTAFGRCPEAHARTSSRPQHSQCTPYLCCASLRPLQCLRTFCCVS